MSIQDWAAVAEIIGAIGVIASLLYVGRQLRQTNAMSRSEIRRDLSAQASAMATSVAASPDLAATMAKVHFHGLVRSEATDIERIQAAYIFVALVGQVHMAYEQFREGFMSSQEVKEYMGSNTALLTKPYLRSVWPVLRVQYPADFQNWFENQHGLSADSPGNDKDS